MNEFVEQCRAEWRRLGVAEPVADEMAADLAADLAAAEAEDVSVEDYLGTSASDPRALASSWARERGVVPTPPRGERGRRRPLPLVASAVLAALAALVAAVLLVTGEPKVFLTARPIGRQGLVSPGSGGPTPAVIGHRLATSAAAPVEWILLSVAILGLGLSIWLWSRWDRSHRTTA